MLTSLRQGGFIKGLMGVIVVLIIVAFAMDYRGGGVTAIGGEDCAVKVDSECVPAKDYNMLLRLVGPSGASDKELRKAGFVEHALDGLVERELLLAEARRLGVAVSEEDLDKELALGRVHFSWPVDAPLPQALAQGMPYPSTGASELVTYLRVKNSKTDAFDYEIYRRQIQNLLRMSPREFKERQAQEVIAARVRALIASPVRVSEDEAFSAFERDKSQATVRSVSLPRSWFERYVVSVTDAEAQAYDKAHSADVDTEWNNAKVNWKGDCVAVAEIAFPLGSEPSEEERAEQKKQADQAAEWIKQGVPFERVSQWLGKGFAALQGGAAGCFDAARYGDKAEGLTQTLAALKAGEVSAVQETVKGFYVFKSLGKLSVADAERVGRLQSARRVALQNAAKDRTHAAAKQLLDKAKAGAELSASLTELLAAQVNVAGLDDKVAAAVREAALAAGDIPEFEVSRAFSRSGSPVPGLKQRDVANRIFDLPNPDSVLDEVLETYAGYAVVQLKEKTLATRAEFDKDKAELMAGLNAQKRAEALSRYVARLRERAKKIEINPTYSNPPAPEGSGKAPSDATNSG